MPNLDETRTPGAQTTAAVAPGIQDQGLPGVSGWAPITIVDRVARETVDRRTTVTAEPRTPSTGPTRGGRLESQLRRSAWQPGRPGRQSRRRRSPGVFAGFFCCLPSGAAKRPLQSPQESRSRLPRCEGMGRDRPPPTEIARSRNRDDFVDARRSRRREHRRSHASPNAIAARFARAHESAQRAHPSRTHLTLPAAGDRIDPLRRHTGRQPTAPAATVAGMTGQLGQVPLDVAEGDALAGLVGVWSGGSEPGPHRRRRR